MKTRTKILVLSPVLAAVVLRAIFNQGQFLSPEGNISDVANFGTVVQTRDPRLVQCALKLLF
ncbi:MAG TPA: hypothetical protein VEV41_20615 [Terriglobales bacterium]|nr:hypothetical protein [Terriglobales bacterium]